MIATIGINNEQHTVLCFQDFADLVERFMGPDAGKFLRNYNEKKNNSIAELELEISEKENELNSLNYGFFEVC